MRRMAVAGLLLVLAGAGATACTPSDDAAASSATGGGSDLCNSIASLKLSAGKLSDMQVSQNGVAAMRDQLGVVRTDLTRVITFAKDKYGDVVAVVQKDVDTLKSAAAGVKENPSRDALNSVRPPLDALITDVKD